MPETSPRARRRNSPATSALCAGGRLEQAATRAFSSGTRAFLGQSRPGACAMVGSLRRARTSALWRGFGGSAAVPVRFTQTIDSGEWSSFPRRNRPKADPASADGRSAALAPLRRHQYSRRCNGRDNAARVSAPQHLPVHRAPWHARRCGVVRARVAVSSTDPIRALGGATDRRRGPDPPHGTVARTLRGVPRSRRERSRQVDVARARAREGYFPESRSLTACTRNRKSDVPYPSTYSVCCHRWGHSRSSMKSGLMSALPETTPPGMCAPPAL